MGRAHVEREGVSVRHAARFLLVGTMNPEEGELRPQLLDRFGLTVEVRAPPRAGGAGRGGAPAARVRGRPGRRSPPGWATPTPSWPHGSSRPGSALPHGACCRDARAATGSPGLRWRSRWTGCAPTSSSPAPRSRWPPGTAATRSPTDDVADAARLALPHRRRRDPFDAPGPDEQRSTTRCDDAGDRRRPGPDRRRRPGGADPTARPGRRRRRTTAARRRRAADAADRPSGPHGDSAGRHAEHAQRESGDGPTGPGDADRPRPARRPRGRCGSARAGRGAGARPGRRLAARPRAAAAAAVAPPDAALAACTGGHRASRRAAPARPRPHRGAGLVDPRQRPARGVHVGREAQPGAVRRRRLRLDGRPAADGARSRAPCCRCCATPTSDATRSA